jgi:hypothetical protein
VKVDSTAETATQVLGIEFDHRIVVGNLFRNETSDAVSHDILGFSARVLNTTASVGALTSFEG